MSKYCQTIDSVLKKRLKGTKTFNEEQREIISEIIDLQIEIKLNYYLSQHKKAK